MFIVFIYEENYCLFSIYTFFYLKIFGTYFHFTVFLSNNMVNLEDYLMNFSNRKLCVLTYLYYNCIWKISGPKNRKLGGFTVVVLLLLLNM